IQDRPSQEHVHGPVRAGRTQRRRRHLVATPSPRLDLGTDRLLSLEHGRDGRGAARALALREHVPERRILDAAKTSDPCPWSDIHMELAAYGIDPDRSGLELGRGDLAEDRPERLERLDRD